jgi:apolipoprotein N-acyltransferase
MEMTQRLAQRGAEIVVWPEARFKGYFDQPSVREAYRYGVAGHGAAGLFHGLERHVEDGRAAQYNTAALLDPSGDLLGSYRKIKRFAFGEYAPLISEIPILRQWVVRYFGEFLQEITPGDRHRVFDVAGMRIVPKICYESAFPVFLADSVAGDAQGKVIVLLSQDGWFGESRQPSQHLWQSAVRAVENRVPVVHVINNGPSGIILPNGRYAFRTTPFVRSEAVADMPYSLTSGGSFFSRHPRLFIALVYGAFIVLAGMRLLPELRRIRLRRRSAAALS